MITETQNRPENIRLLGAQRQLYSDAKNIVLVRLGLIVFLPLLFSTIAATFMSFKPWASLYGVVGTLFDLVFLERWIKATKKQASAVQETFDCNVLELKWDEFRFGERPRQEVVVEANHRFLSKMGDPSKLVDWYPTDVAKVPLPFGRLICQRTNMWWSHQLLNRCRVLTISAISMLLLIGLSASLASRASLEAFLAIFLVPLMPLFTLGLKVQSGFLEAKKDADRVIAQVERAWREALSEMRDTSVIEGYGRAIQSEIFALRSKMPMIPEWVYWLYRGSSQNTAVLAGQLMVIEATEVAKPQA